MKIVSPRQLILKARFYRVFGFVFAGLGLLIFLTIFVKLFDANFFMAAKEPAIILVVLIPFVPACILSMISSSCEKKALSMLEKEGKAA